MLFPDGGGLRHSRSNKRCGICCLWSYPGSLDSVSQTVAVQQTSHQYVNNAPMLQLAMRAWQGGPDFHKSSPYSKGALESCWMMSCITVWFVNHDLSHHKTLLRKRIIGMPQHPVQDIFQSHSLQHWMITPNSCTIYFFVCQPPGCQTPELCCPSPHKSPWDPSTLLHRHFK